MSSQQITTWLQCLFLFAVIWTLGGTITGDSRKKFDAFYRNLISGVDVNHPQPQSIKLQKSHILPERGHKYLTIIVYHYYTNLKYF